ncbi:hypothetical protein Tco_0758942 [Tanacetum coccineum]
MCHHDAIEKREDIVHYTAQLLGRSRKILEILKTRRLPNLDVDSTADIDVLHENNEARFTSRVEIDPKYLSIQGSFVSILKLGKPNNVMSDKVLPYLILDDSRFSELITLGGLWVLIETVSTSVKEKLLNHTSVGSWFSSLKLAYNSFVSNERVILISLKVLSLKVWTHNTFAKVASKWGDLVEWEDLAKKLYFEMEACDLFICNDYYGSDSSGDEEDAKDDRSQEIKSQQIMMLREPLNQVRKDSSDDLKYPPGFTPIVVNVEEVNEKEKEATSNEAKISIQFNLSDINKILDHGDSNEEIISDRSLLSLKQQADLERNVSNEEIKSMPDLIGFVVHVITSAEYELHPVNTTQDLIVDRIDEVIPAEKGNLETRNEKMQTPIHTPPRSFRNYLSSDKATFVELTDNHDTISVVLRTSDLPRILKKSNDALHVAVPKISIIATNDHLKDTFLKIISQLLLPMII